MVNECRFTDCKHVKVTATLVKNAEKPDGTHVIDVIRLSEIE